MEFETILTEERDGIFIITFNRLEARNAMNNLMTKEIGDALEYWDHNDDLRVCIITNNGHVFCAGSDLKELAAGAYEVPEGREKWGFAAMTKRSFDKPIIAAVHGKALGGGFLEGVKTIAPCLPMIWAILSITYVLQEGNIIHTILYHVYNLTSSMSKTGALFAIFLFVVALEFIVGSGTAKAFLIMPIVLPLADLLGLTRQSIVLAFTMGDGFCNILYPTSGIMVIAIGMVGISYGKYLRWSWKLFVMEFGLAALAMLGAVAIGY